MPHPRFRYLEPTLKKALTWSPCTALIGMRQTGKSTLLKKLCQAYHTFDDALALPRFESNASAILEAGPYPLALDEVQKLPSVFDALKLSIDRKKTPGRFLLSGSVRFSSRKGIRESLTGRIAAFELFPLSVAESLGENQLLDLQIDGAGSEETPF